MAGAKAAPCAPRTPHPLAPPRPKHYDSLMVMAAQTVRWGRAPTPSCAIDDDCTETDWDTGDDPDEHLYYCQDANFNTTALLERSDGSVVERYTYDPYGKVTIHNGDWSSTVTWGNSKKNEVLYCGYRYDHEGRLYHVRHRSYHPTLGRFLQRDPIGYADGMSLCAYCNANPSKGPDPLGLWGWPLWPFLKHLPDFVGPRDGVVVDVPKGRTYQRLVTPREITRECVPAIEYEYEETITIENTQTLPEEQQWIRRGVYRLVQRTEGDVTRQIWVCRCWRSRALDSTFASPKYDYCCYWKKHGAASTRRRTVEVEIQIFERTIMSTEDLMRWRYRDKWMYPPQDWEKQA